MATPLVSFVSGDTTAIPYTPGSAVTGGDVVVQGSLVAIAKLDIAANKLGALHVGGIWRCPKSSGSAGESITAGAQLYWDATNEVVTATAGANKAIGKAVEDAGATATTVDVLVEQ